jgi:hypothetical protein
MVNLLSGIRIKIRPGLLIIALVAIVIVVGFLASWYFLRLKDDVKIDPIIFCIVIVVITILAVTIIIFTNASNGSLIDRIEIGLGDFIISAILAIIGFVSAFCVFSIKEDIKEDVFIALIIFLITIISLLTTISIGRMRYTIEKDVKSRLHLQCEFNDIAKHIETIMKKITESGVESPKTKLAEKRLNGLKQKLTDIEIRNDIAEMTIKRLKDHCNLSFYAVSSFSIEECLEPVVIQYFVEQAFTCVKKKSDNRCFISWDSIPGSDNEKLKNFLKDNHDIDGVEDENIIKSEDKKRINIYTANNHSIEIIRDEKEETAILKKDGDIIRELNVKTDNNELKLNIFVAERYFVYNPEMIYKYQQELAAFKRIHILGEIDFTVLDEKKLKERGGEILDKIDSNSKNVLNDRNFLNNTLCNQNEHMPDFLLIDKNYVYPRDKSGEVKPSDDQEDCAYYSALIKFFQKAKEEEEIRREIIAYDDC